MACFELVRDLERHGAAVVPAAVGGAARDTLWAAIQPATAAGAVRSRGQDPYGARGLLVARPELPRRLAELRLDDIARQAMGRDMFPIDASFFDKRSEVNWAVPAHQDVVVPVPPGADPRTVRHARARDGMTYGEPGDDVLRELVALRVHFDDAGADNGGLAIAAGSHLLGRLSSAEIRKIPSVAFNAVDCRAGDVLLMRPLAVHRSGRSTIPSQRRVLHILYAPRGGWHSRSPKTAA